MKLNLIKSLGHYKFKSVYLAFSGGIDSCVLLHTLLKRNIEVELLFIHHNTEWCNTELDFTKHIAEKYNISYRVYHISQYDNTTSKECFWSVERNKIFQEMVKPVFTGHHLDDSVEWYIMSAFQGQPKVLDYNNQNVYRPMLLIDKEKINEYAKVHNLEYLEDPSNSDNSFNLRNKVRNLLIPKVKQSFPGIHTTVKKLILKKESNKNGK